MSKHRSISAAVAAFAAVACQSHSSRVVVLSPKSGPEPSMAAEVPALEDSLAQSSIDVEPYRSVVDALTHEAMDRGRAYESLKSLCTTAPHRLSGSGDAATAIKWAQQAMTDAGLVNVHTEPVMVPHWVRGARESLYHGGVGHARAGESHVVALGGSVATPAEGLDGGVIEVSSFDELHKRADHAKGCFVFFNRPLDPSKDPFEAYGGAVDQRHWGAVEAGKVGAIGAIVRSMTMSHDDFAHTGGLAYDDNVPRVPAVAISSAGADLLSGLLKKNPDLQLHLELDCKWLEDAPSFNVVGDLVGSEKPDEIVVVGGHLDNWDVGQGAHDDGAGCMHALEAARIIHAHGKHPRRTIRVVFFINEENGARGAQAYYDAHKDEMDKHVLALESDRGGFVPRGFETDASPENLAALRSIQPLLAPLGIEWVRPGHGGTDIGPMAKSGVITVGFVPDPQRYFDFHHSERDTLDNVHPRELELGAAAIAGLLYVVADMPTPLPHNPPPPPKPETK